MYSKKRSMGIEIDENLRQIKWKRLNDSGELLLVQL